MCRVQFDDTVTNYVLAEETKENMEEIKILPKGMQFVDTKKELMLAQLLDSWTMHIKILNSISDYRDYCIDDTQVHYIDYRASICDTLKVLLDQIQQVKQMDNNNSNFVNLAEWQ